MRPNWIPDAEISHCPRCSAQFGLFVRRHHCRNCGCIYCSHCSNFFAPVDAYKDFTPACTVSPFSIPSTKRRVCQTCFSTILGSGASDDEDEYFWLQAQEDLDAVRFAVGHIITMMNDDLNISISPQTPKTSSLYGIERIQKRWGEIPERHANGKLGNKNVYDELLKQMETHLTKKDKDGFSAVLKQAKKRIVIDYEKVQGEEWFWQLAEQDFETVQAALKDMSALMKERNPILAEFQSESTNDHSDLLEQLEGCSEVKDKEGFLGALLQAKNRIIEDVAKIMRIENENKIKVIDNNTKSLVET